MALSYSLSSQRLGNTTASSLVKSAATLTNELATYDDEAQALAFSRDPTNANLDTYISYLQNRAHLLSSTGKVTDATKAMEILGRTIPNAVKTSTSFNINLVSTQMLSSGASDQVKLDYIANNVLNNSIVQDDPSMYAHYMERAYSLQQSIEYERQVQANAAETAAKAQEAAVKNGYDNVESQLKDSWNYVLDAYKSGQQSKIQTALNSFTKQNAPVLEAHGIKLPKGSQVTLASAALGYMYGRIAYYNNAAESLGVQTPDGQAMMAKAQGLLSGATTIKTPFGDGQNIYQVIQAAYSPTNLYSKSTDDMGRVSASRNAIVGYRMTTIQTPFGTIDTPIPLTSGNAESSYTMLTTQNGKTNNGTVDSVNKQLQGLGFTSDKQSGGFEDKGELKVVVSDKAAKWLDAKGTNGIQAGDRLTLIPTSQGYQFISGNNVFGLSFSDRGLAGLYKQQNNGSWQLAGGQYGFNPHATASLPSVLSGSAQERAQASITAEKLQSQNVAAHAAHIASMSFNQAPFQAEHPNPQPAFQITNRNNNGPTMAQRAGGGYNFTYHGRAISAASYAQITNTPFRSLLQTMANNGDSGAHAALNFVGNDFGYNPNMIGNNGNLYNALVWGTGHQFRGATPQFDSSGQLTLPSGLRL